MNKKLIIIALAVVAVGVIYLAGQWLTKSGEPAFGEKRSLFVGNDLAPVSLTVEEKEFAEEQEIEFSSGDDFSAENLKVVRNSDEVSDIESDIIETNLSGLDEETDSINSDLSSY